MYIVYVYGLGDEKGTDGQAIDLFLARSVAPRFPPRNVVKAVKYHANIAQDILATDQFGPIVLLGFSNGVGGAVRAANDLAGKRIISHMIMIDGVPPWDLGFVQGFAWHLHANILRATSIQKSPNIPPISCGIQNAGPTYCNLPTISRPHTEIPGDLKIQEYIMAILEAEDASAKTSPPSAIPMPVPIANPW